MSTDPNKADFRALFKRALTTLEEQQAKLSALEQAQREPLAIIGLGCCFPGDANDPDTFWKVLHDGVDTVTEIPADRWDVEAFYDLNPDTPGKTYSRWGAFLKDVDKFDTHFFGITPREAMRMDPQQRLVLEVTWEALENAGCAPASLAGSRTGVFLGMTTSDYAHLQTRYSGPEAIDSYFGSGVAHSIAAGRISYALGLQGPSIAVDTACSSSLVTTHLACQSLRTRECDIALAGGVNLILSPDGAITASRSRMMSFDGRCKTFDAKADGYVRGEGCGMVVLKRLSDALANGDTIMAVILGTALNQDGRSNGLTAPNGLAQEDVIRTALANAGVKPSDVSYVETHGTGTTLGDPIEIRALGAVFADGHSKANPLMVGSVKTNVGHLEAAAGIVGLIKVVLALKHKAIPPHLHFREPNPYIDWDSLPIVVPTQATPWIVPSDARRIAGLSSFGFSGTNAHLIIAEAPVPETLPVKVERPLHLMSLSAKTEQALKELAGRFEGYLSEQPAESIANICFTTNTGRSHFGNRLALIAESAAQAREKLTAWIAGESSGKVMSGTRPSGELPKVAFLFTGQGSQYVGMGHYLYQTQPTFRQTLDRCDELLRPYLKQPLLSVLYPRSGETSPLDETAYTQPALFALEYALAGLWRSWGIQPLAVMGHSVGEYVAACIAGMFSLEDGLRLIAERARLMQALPQNGEMAAVFADEARVGAAIAPFTDEVSIAAINGPENVVISGERSSVQAVLQQLSMQGISARQLTVSHAFHSPLMEPMLDAFERVASTIESTPPRLALISNVTGQRVTGDDAASAAYWRRHVRQPVRFADSIKTLHELGCEVFVEIGPSSTLLSMAQRCLPDTSDVWLPSLRQGRDDWPQMLESLATLYVHGADVDWQGLDRDYVRRKIALPTYPFQRQRYWSNTSVQAKASRVRTAAIHPLLDRQVYSPLVKETVFESQLSTNSPGFLTDHRIFGMPLFPAAGYLEMAAAAATYSFGQRVRAIEDIEIQEALLLPENETRTVQVVLSPEKAGKASFRVFSLEDKNWKLHAAGAIDLAESKSVTPDSMLLEDIRIRCTEEVSVAAYYRQLAEIGIDYGPTFRGITQLRRRNGEALGRIRLPETASQEAHFFQLHPALLDACFQTLGVALASFSDKSDPNVYVPVGVERYGVYQPRHTQAWCHARVREGTSVDMVDGDVSLFDDQEQLVAQVTGLRLRRVSREALQPTTRQQLDDWLYHVEWRPKQLEAKDTLAEPGSWLIFCDQSGVGETLAARLHAQDEECCLVQPGDRYQSLGNGRWQIDPQQSDDFRRLLREALTNQRKPYRGAVYLWSLDTSRDITTATLRADQSVVCGGALYLAQALAERADANRPMTNAAGLWLVTRGAQPVSTSDPFLAVAQTPLWGLGRTIAVERTELGCACVDVDPSDDAQTVQVLFDEIQARDVENQIAYRTGKRYIARLARSTFEQAAQPLAIHADGSYLITGGLGGLGLKTAEWLVKRGARHLVLMGRSGASEAARQAITELERAGAQIVVAKGDVSNEQDVARILSDIKPPVRGIIHAAGVLDDGALLQQSWQRFEKVLAPKLFGAWHLHSLTQQMPLDFFVLFSAGAALLGSPGQTNYAAANAFLDGLAHYRHALGLPALSINWGAWSGVGMAINLEHRLQENGLGVITPEQGARIFEHMLGHPATQIAALPINWQKLTLKVGVSGISPMLTELVGQTSVISSSIATSLEPDLMQRLKSASASERRDVIFGYIRTLVCQVIGLASPDSLDVDQSLSSLGLDSLMAVELRNRLQVDLGIVVPIAQLLQGPSVNQLSSMALDQTTTAAVAQPIESIQPDRLLAKLDQLSDDQVDSLLNELLANEPPTG